MSSTNLTNKLIPIFYLCDNAFISDDNTSLSRNTIETLLWLSPVEEVSRTVRTRFRERYILKFIIVNYFADTWPCVRGSLSCKEKAPVHSLLRFIIAVVRPFLTGEPSRGQVKRFKKRRKNASRQRDTASSKVWYFEEILECTLLVWSLWTSLKTSSLPCVRGQHLLSVPCEICKCFVPSLHRKKYNCSWKYLTCAHRRM